MSDGNNDNSVAFGVKDDAPISDSQPRACATFKMFHVALPRLREGIELGIESSPHIRGEAEPLMGCRGREDDLHLANIAYRVISVNRNIAKCDDSSFRAVHVPAHTKVLAYIVAVALSVGMLP